MNVDPQRLVRWIHWGVDDAFQMFVVDFGRP
jgi:hypothetical protein